MDSRVKSIVDKNFQEIRAKTGLNLSYGKIARTFWSTLASNPRLRRECMELVCETIVKNSKKNRSRTASWKKDPKK
jgi:predicted nucleic-acid-binding protein